MPLSDLTDLTDLENALIQNNKQLIEFGKMKAIQGCYSTALAWFAAALTADPTKPEVIFLIDNLLNDLEYKPSREDMIPVYLAIDTIQIRVNTLIELNKEQGDDCVEKQLLEIVKEIVEGIEFEEQDEPEPDEPSPAPQ